MKRSWRSILKSVLLVPAVALCLPWPAQPQSQETAAVLDGLRLSDPRTRSEAFYRLLGVDMKNTGSARIGVKRLTKNNPDQAERIKTALILALENEGAYREGLAKNRQIADEAYSDYYGDLIAAVTSLRDLRAAKGLLGAVDTGAMATSGLADLGASVVDALVEKSRDSNYHVRAGSISALGQLALRQDVVQGDAVAIAKIRMATLAAADDPEWYVRTYAVGALMPFRQDPNVKAKLEVVIATDPYASPFLLTAEGGSRFPVREAAMMALKATEDDIFFVVRTSDRRECRIRRGIDARSVLRFIGPIRDEENAVHSMCTHYDEAGTDPAMCWIVLPRNACGR
jgi:hypothetical protein